jgi:hypothetical protein
MTDELIKRAEEFVKAGGINEVSLNHTCTLVSCIKDLLTALKGKGWMPIAEATKLKGELYLSDGKKIWLGRYEAKTCTREIDAGNGLFRKEDYECGRWKTGWGFSWEYIEPTHYQILTPPSD